MNLAFHSAEQLICSSYIVSGSGGTTRGGIAAASLTMMSNDAESMYGTSHLCNKYGNL